MPPAKFDLELFMIDLVKDIILPNTVKWGGLFINFYIPEKFIRWYYKDEIKYIINKLENNKISDKDI